MTDRLLIISADARLRELARDTFEDDFEVHEANNGKFALRMARAIHPALIILDDTLAGDAEGATLAAMIHEDPALAGARLVQMATSQATPAWLSACGQATMPFGVLDLVGSPLRAAA